MFKFYILLWVYIYLQIILNFYLCFTQFPNIFGIVIVLCNLTTSLWTKTQKHRNICLLMPHICLLMPHNCVIGTKTMWDFHKSSKEVPGSYIEKRKPVKKCPATKVQADFITAGQSRCSCFHYLCYVNELQAGASFTTR